MTAVKIMGILNVTPDSFSDGGKFDGSEVERALQMIEQGADIIDVGGESTGLGSKDVSLEEELGRVIPIIEGIRAQNKTVSISIDTWKSEVARQTVQVGATMVNDVTAFRGDPEMAKTVAKLNVPVVLMYSKDSTPRTTKNAVEYDDVMATIKIFLQERIAFAEKEGVAHENIIIDPGMGAFVSAEPKYSYEILARLRELEDLDCPILVGTSRKSFLGGELEDRLEGSLSTAMEAMMNGASILRVHDVDETRQMVDFAQKLL